MVFIKKFKLWVWEKIKTRCRNSFFCDSYYARLEELDERQYKWARILVVSCAALTIWLIAIICKCLFLHLHKSDCLYCFDRWWAYSLIIGGGIYLFCFFFPTRKRYQPIIDDH